MSATGECNQPRIADIDAAELDDRQPHADIAELGAEQERGEALQGLSSRSTSLIAASGLLWESELIGSTLY
jgi:hypothetical protein